MRKRTGRMPSVEEAKAERERLNQPENFRDSLSYGAEYFGMMLDQFNGDVSFASAAYRSGPGAVRQFLRTGNINELRRDAAADEDPAARLALGGYRPTGVDMVRG